MYLVVMSEVKPMMSHQHDLLKSELNKDNTNRLGGVQRENHWGLNLIPRVGEIVFRRESHTIWLSSTKRSALKAYTYL